MLLTVFVALSSCFDRFLTAASCAELPQPTIVKLVKASSPQIELKIIFFIKTSVLTIVCVEGGFLFIYV